MAPVGTLAEMEGILLNSFGEVQKMRNNGIYYLAEKLLNQNGQGSWE